MVKEKKCEKRFLVVQMEMFFNIDTDDIYEIAEALQKSLDVMRQSGGGHVPSSGVKARQPHNLVNQKAGSLAPPPSARRSSRWRPSLVPMRRWGNIGPLPTRRAYRRAP